MPPTPAHASTDPADAAAATEANAPAVQGGGDHDRVVMLTLHPDGTPRQHNPEIIGDKQFATDAAKRQFAEQAVSAVDVEMRGATADSDSERDPDTLRAAHETARDAAHERAEATVEQLHRGVGD